MAKQKPSEDPSTLSMAHQIMIDRLERAERLLGGTSAMRDAGQDMLPLHPEETSDGWNDRLEQNVLFNSYKLTLGELSGKPFSEPIAIQEDVPEAVAEHLEDVDLQGNTLDAFCYQWFKDALRGAFSIVMVDFPRVQEKVDAEGNPVPRTLADDRAENLRPYWTRIQAEQVIAGRVERIHGVEMLTHLRLMETVVEPDGFAEEELEQIRVYELDPETGGVLVQLWRKEFPSRKSSKWIVVDQYVMAIGFIPAVVFYTDREGPLQGNPILDDLAFLNIRHWQSMSDQIRALTVSRFAMLVGKGIYENETSDIVMGPEQAMMIPADADLFWLEAQGLGTEAGRQELLDLEERMGAYGGQFLKKQPGNMTATARALDTAESLSVMQAVTISFQSCIEQCLLYHAMWMAMEDGGSVKVNTEMTGVDETDSATLATLDKAADENRISRRAWVEEMKRRNVLAEDYDPDEDEVQLEKEFEEAMARMPDVETDIDPEGGNDAPEETPDQSGDQTQEI